MSKGTFVGDLNNANNAFKLLINIPCEYGRGCLRGDTEPNSNVKATLSF